MKSTPEQLESRGYLTAEKFEKYRYKPGIDNLIASRIPVERTAGIRRISLAPDKSYLEILCLMLVKERKLYTRLEICETLVKYGEDAIPHLIQLLGKAGKNQHKRAAIIDLNKKSYPLPRDIAARVLVRIGPAVLRYIDTPGFNIGESELSELIDVIGHITYNYSDYRCEKLLLDIYRVNEDELIRWKIIRAFQGFRSDEVKGILQRIVSEDKSEIPVREARRSLERIEDRKA